LVTMPFSVSEIGSMTRNPDTPGVIIWPPLLFLLMVGLGVGLHFCLPVTLPARGPLRVAGGILAAAAGIVAVWARHHMKRAGTNVRPDRPTTAIVTAGPFAFSRNPLYLSVCILNLAIGLILADIWPIVTAAIMAAVLQWGVISREERYLEAKFGDAYVEYRNRVRRWL
jgi:protein-S-isoprenylcysteine O-methyltransferase Ste14